MSFREGWRLPHTIRRHFGEITCVVAVALAGAAIAAPEASAVNVPPPGGVTSEQCVGQAFGLSNARQSCVVDLQVLLSNIGESLTADGIYGPLTATAVFDFNRAFLGGAGGEVAYPRTWTALCRTNAEEGFEGAYWHGAGCPSVV